VEVCWINSFLWKCQITPAYCAAYGLRLYTVIQSIVYLRELGIRANKSNTVALSYAHFSIVKNVSKIYDKMVLVQILDILQAFQKRSVADARDSPVTAMTTR
jgi:hypothetical protein